MNDRAQIPATSGVRDKPWYVRPADDVLQTLHTSDRKGLSSTEASERLTAYGPNEVETETGPTRWEILLHQFRDPLIYILMFAAFITFVLQDFADSAVITAVVMLNALIGYVQESKAQSSMRALSRLSAPRVHVIRDGREVEIASRELVPGDLVLLSSGTRVAADMRIVRIKGLEVDESALTGESAVVRKVSDPLEEPNVVSADQKNMVFAGTIVARGRAKAVVVRTGASTELGKIASSVKEIGIVRTPLQEKVDKLGHYIGYIILGFAILIAVIGIMHQMDPSEVFVTVVAMAVSAIPEGLPVVLTITLAIGVRRMANRKAIIRSLPAVETLGSTTVIGSDKTGTLTKNQMTVQRIWADNRFYETTETGYQLNGLLVKDGEVVSPSKESGLYQSLIAGTLASEASVESLEADDPQGDPTELALHVSAYKGGIRLSDLRLSMEELDILPFESERKFMATLNRDEDGTVIYLKGAPEQVMEMCEYQLVDGQLTEPDRKKIREAASQMAEMGLRVLAMAYRKGNETGLDDERILTSGFILTGLQGMEDPVRPEVLESVKITQRAGIRVIMITGDHIDTAVAIGRQLGLDPQGHGALEGTVLDQLSDQELSQKLQDINIFARVSPVHKYRIVDLLKKVGHIVAITGDGVNDAPALQAAHLGAAMGLSGTDVAREASDMVLSDDNFATITAAVEEGRIVFSNIRKVTFFLLSTAVGELIVIFVAVLMNWPLPFIAVQILWINLVTNGLQDIALAFEPGESNILRRKPRPPQEGILTARLMERLGGVGLVLATGTLGMFWWTYEQTGNLDMARTAAMTQMVVFQFFHVLNCRSLDRSLFRINFFSNKFLFISLTAAILAHLAILHTEAMQALFRTMPLSAEQWVQIIAVGLLVILGGELDKYVNRWRKSFIG